jgi:apolipoprotein N-acyltransferase
MTNALILRGAETDSFQQRIPVPIAMWNPLKTAAARLNISGAGVINLHGERAAVLICYEQLLTWPVLASMAERPTVLIAIANNHSVTGTPIPRFQLAAVRAWARLFRLPYFSAVNW